MGDKLHHEYYAAPQAGDFAQAGEPFALFAAWFEEAKKIFRERLAARFAHLDKHLASNDYLMGRSFSVADAYLFVVSNWAPRVDVDLSPYPNLLAYRKRIGSRPAVQAAMKDEGLMK